MHASGEWSRHEMAPFESMGGLPSTSAAASRKAVAAAGKGKKAAGQAASSGADGKRPAPNVVPPLRFDRAEQA